MQRTEDHTPRGRVPVVLECDESTDVMKLPPTCTTQVRRHQKKAWALMERQDRSSPASSCCTVTDFVCNREQLGVVAILVQCSPQRYFGLLSVPVFGVGM